MQAYAGAYSYLAFASRIRGAAYYPHASYSWAYSYSAFAIRICEAEYDPQPIFVRPLPPRYSKLSSPRGSAEVRQRDCRVVCDKCGGEALFLEKYCCQQLCNTIDANNRYPDRVPVIVERHPGARDTEIKAITKKKFLTPLNYTGAQFIALLRNHLQLESAKSIYLFVENSFQGKVTHTLIRTRPVPARPRVPPSLAPAFASVAVALFKSGGSPATTHAI
jgi:hypothetical protein